VSHFDEHGDARMVDVGAKAETARTAIASGAVEMAVSTSELVQAGEAAKGDVLAVARIAALAGLKRTAELIPLCHPVRVVGSAVELDVAPGRIGIRATVHAIDRTGVEMEALTAVTVAALTIYDMLKSVDRAMRIVDVQLEEKSGGKTGAWHRTEKP
jgi:cyclic pyranopterin phosphate synthase